MQKFEPAIVKIIEHQFCVFSSNFGRRQATFPRGAQIVCKHFTRISFCVFGSAPVSE